MPLNRVTGVSCYATWRLRRNSRIDQMYRGVTSDEEYSIAQRGEKGSSG